METSKKELSQEIKDIQKKLKNKELSEQERKELLTHFQELRTELFTKYHLTICP